MADWQIVYRDTDKVIERRPTTRKDADGLPVFEERTTYTNQQAPEARLAAVEAAVEAVTQEPA